MIYNSKYTTTLLLFIILWSSITYAQNIGNYENLTYEQLKILKDSAYNQNKIEELNRLIFIHRKKAGHENNNIEIARSYYYKTIIENDSLNFLYADSIVLITHHSKHLSYPTFGYIRKGKLLFDIGKFDLSLENYLIASDLAIQKGNEEHIQLISFMIAAIRNINGQPREAMNMYQKSFFSLKKAPNYTIDKYSDYIVLIHNIALSHLRLKQLDSVEYYTNIGLFASQKMNDSLFVIDFKMVEAELNFFKKDYQKTIDTIMIYVDNYEGVDKAINLYYLGQSHMMLKQSSKAIDYFKQIDSIVTQNQDPFDEVRNVYYELILNASMEDQDNQQLEYIGRLIHFDSLLNSYKANVFNTSSVSYDIPLLKKQKTEIEKRLKNKNQINLVLIYLSLIGLISIIYFFIREKRLQLKIKKILEDSVNKPNIIEPLPIGTINIPNDIISTILIQLENFEKNLEYLDKEIDLPRLSNSLDTNTSYLSMIINHYKKLSFPSYLKQLRIQHAVIELSNNPELLKYNYQGLAEIFGFKTSESFSRAFYSQTGVYPSKIIKQLKKRIRDDNL